MHTESAGIPDIRWYTGIGIERDILLENEIRSEVKAHIHEEILRGWRLIRSIEAVGVDVMCC